MSKKDAVVFLEAGRMIAQGEDTYSCCALAKALGVYDDWNENRLRSPLINSYGRRFVEARGKPLWLECKEQRVIALCFAAAMADAGDI